MFTVSDSNQSNPQKKLTMEGEKELVTAVNYPVAEASLEMLLFALSQVTRIRPHRAIEPNVVRSRNNAAT